jgi:EAL domain-containing protein (putative c-di-GMP-specific phosphodiesterase class I)
LLPEKIVIEVTEQYCNISEHEMSMQCKNLKNLGLRLALDDFGSGISNLSMLEIMKPSYIKISGRFIKNSHSDLRKQKIIKNVLDLACALDIIPIVESVELEQEWQQVKTLGARLAQGFYFFRPMDKEDLCALFDTALV